MKTPKIEIYDTTLRDGSQGQGISFSVADKLRIAEKLDAFAVHYIEGGWPGSNPKDLEFFAQAKKRNWKNALLAAFGSTRKKNTPVAEDKQVRLLLEAETPVVTIFGKTWLLHIKKVLGTTPEENLAMIAETVRHLKKHGKFVIYDAEHAFDGYKTNPDYALKTWRAAQEAGADLVVLCDTNGGCLPDEIADTTAAARKNLLVKIGIHTHNDAGLAVANALAAVKAGAVHAQATVNGYGERTGNCNLISLVPCLHFKMKKRCVPERSLTKLTELARFVDEVANLSHDPRQPWVGSSAFAHKGGVHLDAMRKATSSYEHIAPEAVGNSRRVLMSDLSGKANVLLKAKELGLEIKPDAPELPAILRHLKELEHQGYEFEAADGSFLLLLKKKLEHYVPPFSVKGYHVSVRRDGNSEDSGRACDATIKLTSSAPGSSNLHTVADGDGPINALDNALRQALAKVFPEIKSVRLVDYKVRILNGGQSSAAKTRVLITLTDGKKEWTTVGVDENIIEASLIALQEGYEFKLLRR